MAKKKAKKAVKAKKVQKSDNEKIIAALAYIVVGLIWYAVDETAKKSAYAKYHVKQGLNLLILYVVAWIVLSIFAKIPILGWIIGSFLLFILGIVCLILAIIGIINAVNEIIGGK